MARRFGPLLSRVDALDEPVPDGPQTDGAAAADVTGRPASPADPHVAAAAAAPAGNSSSATRAGKKPEKEKPEKWFVPKWKGQTLDGTYTFFLRSLRSLPPLLSDRDAY